MNFFDRQRKLLALGFNPGKVDGEDGPKTQAAVTAFQRARGLPATGKFDSTTLAALAGALAPQSAAPRIFIDVGHGERPEGYDPGAVNPLPAPHGTKEHTLNKIAAGAMATALQKRGAAVTVDDKSRGLHAIGLAGKGYDVFVSVHHNAVAPGTKAQYATTRFHNTKSGRDDVAAATAVAAAMAAELGISNKGAHPMALGVLSGAKDAKVGRAILTEGFFMHPQTPANPAVSDMADWATRSGTAAGNAIADVLGLA